MRTDELIQTLAQDVSPVCYRPPYQQLGLPLVLGAAGSLMLLLAILGLRADIRGAALSLNFWIKMAALLAFFVAAFAAAQEIARPESRRSRAIGYVSVASVIGIVAAAAQIARVRPEEIQSAWLGRGAAILCPIRIAILSVPAFATITLALRKLSPTDLHAAGFFAGLLAGSVGALAYALFCRSYSPTYIVTWYGVGILAAAAFGWLLGPRLFRW